MGPEPDSSEVFQSFLTHIPKVRICSDLENSTKKANFTFFTHTVTVGVGAEGRSEHRPFAISDFHEKELPLYRQGAPIWVDV
jgi:hypothetical protein